MKSWEAARDCHLRPVSTSGSAQRRDIVATTWVVAGVRSGGPRAARESMRPPSLGHVQQVHASLACESVQDPNQSAVRVWPPET
jgi:hypothetical protein